jgi:hypothetical protein
MTLCKKCKKREAVFDGWCFECMVSSRIDELEQRIIKLEQRNKKEV